MFQWLQGITATAPFLNKTKDMKEEIKVFRKVCDKCNKPFTFREDMYLHMQDTTEAFDIYVDSITCPHCKKRNILESKDIDGNIHKREFEFLRYEKIW